MKNTMSPLWYWFWYPFVRIVILLDYIPRRLFNGLVAVWNRTNIVIAIVFTLTVVAYSISGIPFLVLWYLGRHTYHTHYVPMVDRLHNDAVFSH